MRYNFEWDPEKAKSNSKKHGVRFEVGLSVFRDPQASSIFDTDHSGDEDRWITLGMASTGAVLVVHHTFAKVDEETITVRIVSCRKATKREQKQYAE